MPINRDEFEKHKILITAFFARIGLKSNDLTVCKPTVAIGHQSEIKSFPIEHTKEINYYPGTAAEFFGIDDN